MLLDMMLFSFGSIVYPSYTRYDVFQMKKKMAENHGFQ